MRKKGAVGCMRKERAVGCMRKEGAGYVCSRRQVVLAITVARCGDSTPTLMRTLVASRLCHYLSIVIMSCLMHSLEISTTLNM